MFSKTTKDENKMAKMESESPAINLIGAGTVIKGDVKANGDLRIDGTVYGSIQSKGKVVIGQSGVVEGEINCQNADISGLIKASVVVAELLSLKSTTKLTGDITTNKLAIEPGAAFSGTCNMSNPQAKDANSFMPKFSEKLAEPAIKETAVK